MTIQLISLMGLYPVPSASPFNILTFVLCIFVYRIICRELGKMKEVTLKFQISATAYIIGESLVAYQIGYVADRCPRR